MSDPSRAIFRREFLCGATSPSLLGLAMALAVLAMAGSAVLAAAPAKSATAAAELVAGWTATADAVEAAADGPALAVSIDTGRLKTVTPFFEIAAE